VKIILADPCELFRSLIKIWLHTENKIRLVAETGDGANVMELLSTKGAELLLMDPALSKVSGLELARKVHETMPHVRMLALYSENRPFVVDRIQKAGFHGCVCKKTNSISNLRIAMESVMEGNSYFCAETCRIQNLIYSNSSSFSRLLSLREQEILCQISYGKDNAAIATELNLSPATVQTHRRNLFRKLGIHDTPALMHYAINQGFCQLGTETCAGIHG
jgi:two-component system NarL family response regulator